MKSFPLKVAFFVAKILFIIIIIIITFFFFLVSNEKYEMGVVDLKSSSKKRVVLPQNFS
jgi:hypothetical protein